MLLLTIGVLLHNIYPYLIHPLPPIIYLCNSEQAKDNAVEMTARAIVDEKKMDEVEV